MAIIHNIMQKCSNIVSTPYTISGSPPHVWGKQAFSKTISTNLRITPTCVGKAINKNVLCYFIRDHLHMCGEYSFPATATLLSGGSPPHVWGKLSGVIEESTISRITPHVWGKRNPKHRAAELRRITPTCVGKAVSLCSHLRPP